ncbi:MAG TPA: alpha-glucosidase [Candidatus Limiplasma sp.]|nr:alpha-glucosidase [Candidatus Limiplasma sp.]
MAQWWKDRIVYQIYPRSFQDSNGDGIGDIPGIISRLDEIQKLGAGILWLSPVYCSPDADNGYDISDYMNINPKFGTLADMDHLFAQAKERDIKIIMDLVINHTSDEHEWFQKSRRREEPYTDYYIWRPANADGSLPNNWTGFFMGSVWQWDELRGEYYLHLFDKKQPDLNWHNPRVMEEVKRIMRFWLSRGAAGFRCDVINILYKTSLDDGKKSLAICGIEHYRSQEGNHEILRELRRDVLDKFDCFTVGECVMVDLEEAKLLCEPQRRELDMLFYFDHLQVDRRLARFVPKPFRAKKLLEVYTQWQTGLDWNALYLENHDQPRIVSHYGNDKKYWAPSAKLLATMELSLRGTPYIYQGQEIGMTNADFQSLDDMNDVESHNIDRMMHSMHIPKRLRWRWIKMASRDNARTPMQWSAEAGAGFTTGKPWLMLNPNYKRINYAVQENDKDSILHYYRRMIALRAQSDTLKYGKFQPLAANRRVMAYRRLHEGECMITALNFSARRARVPYRGQVVIDNYEKATFDGLLEPWEAVILQPSKESTR